ncbi:winged helix-turn-helix domain-containing protein [Pimelobacter simplex]|uniref:winged helix-turn-helix domain-containing protein n=1 Tax=Nocardioides simplex TaxID=2045 RepID=UPI00214FFEB7|nr:winged helix-turn-helix domain-containing protein [Pimelobacter simplex]UUW88711.1 winged helix-turn-helix domain-containing protein [Pimelobacter simplex]UUW98216.1 winged helix-turn-helix domain-containing protein [Pimelobacter simplex]
MKFRGVDALPPSQRHRALADARLWAESSSGRESLILIEPDETEADRIGNDLTHRGLRFATFASPWRALAHLGNEPAAVVVASSNLGPDILKELVEAIKSETTLPVLIAYRSEETDAIGPAVLAGGRPAVGLPYDAHDLVRTLAEVLPQLPPPARIDFGRLSLVPEWRDAQLDGKGLGLSRLEFRVLAELVRRGGRCASKDALVSVAWPEGATDPKSLLTAAVKRLRLKFAALGIADAVETVRGVGYRLNASALAGRRTSPSHQ